MAWQLGDYCSLNDVKVQTNIKGSNMDSVLEDFIHEASDDIDTYTNRKFYERIETRYYHAYDDVDWRDLLLDDDLLGVVEVTINDGATALQPSEYLLMPVNFSPKNCIRLRYSSTNYWQTFFTDPNTSIAVTGSWGFNTGTTPPRRINRACVELVAYRFNSIYAPFEKAGTGDVGSYEVATDIPEAIQRKLQPFRRKQVYATGSNGR